MSTIIFYLFSFGYICLLIWGFFLAQNKFSHTSNVLLLVIVGLIYDNVIIASGKFIGEGALLQTLSYLRFYLHAIVTPTLILFAWSMYHHMNVEEPDPQPSFKILAYLITIGLISYELMTLITGLELMAKREYGLLTYDTTSSMGMPMMIIIVMIVLGLVGFILLRVERNFWMLLGTILTFIGSILTIWFKHPALMNGFEFLLIVSLLITKQSFKLKKLM